MTSSLLATLQLSQVPGLGLVNYWRLIDALGSPQTVVKAEQRTLASIVPEKIQREIAKLQQDADHPARIESEHLLDWCAENNVTLLNHEHRRYPRLLKEITLAPPLLYVQGDSFCLDQPQLAIVGSRTATPAGKKAAHNFAADMVAAGLAVTSGLAMGIDSGAHRGALSVNGRTIAVVATGVDTVYPRRNVRLAQEILDKGGAIVSEFGPNTPPAAHNFPRRNRIISGLSLGTLVVEAAIKSGSLITAKFALEQNREVFAVPGSILNPRSRGCHALIRQGAKLVERSEDILEELSAHIRPGALPERDAKDNPSQLPEKARAVLRYVDYDPVALDAIASQSGLEVGELLSILMQLELDGYIAQTASGFARIKTPERV